MAELRRKIDREIKSASILVVDDEESNIRLIERILSARGYTNISTTMDSTRVVEMHQKYHMDLILLDLNMPERDGFQVMEDLTRKTQGNSPAILVLTAQHMQNLRQRALDNGARDYVTKPFHMEELVSRVRNLLEVQLAHRFMRDQNLLLEKKVRQRTRDIYETRLQVVRHLGRAAEYRDNETGLHIIRMSKIAVILGKQAGMNKYKCELLLNASPMHDIGKIGIPDKILLKPGRLDQDEWEVMKSHAQIGADILSGDDSELMKMAHEIAITHHEKYNGDGYPNNLKGEAIPLVGRITAIADNFDALTSERPYKKAWRVEDAVQWMIGQAGEHFDPQLMGLFVKILPEIIEIKEKYSEPEN